MVWCFLIGLVLGVPLGGLAGWLILMGMIDGMDEEFRREMEKDGSQ